MKVLIGCEFSGRVRDAFLRRGHDAISCDLLQTESPGPHIEGDVFEALEYFGPDLFIVFPSCQFLAVSGARWFSARRAEQEQAIQFAVNLMNGRVDRIAMENPIGVLSTRFRKPDQIIQPWQFGHGETKATCLWLENLPKLLPTEIVTGRHPRVHHESPGPNRWRNRSRTYQGIADAMAAQWG